MTITELFNMAVMRAGHSTAIVDSNESTNAARLCRTFYAQCRNTVLRAHPWNFATKQVALSLTTSQITNWRYVYSIPADCLTVQSLVITGMRQVLPDLRIPFDVKNVAGSKCLLTDLPEAEAIYTARVEDLNIFDPLSLSALGYLLCMEVAMPLTGKADMAANAKNGYLFTLSQAAAADLDEGERGRGPDCEFIAVRN